MSASFIPQFGSQSATVADLNPLLLDAKNIYVTQLAEAMGPYIIKVIEGCYADAVREGSSKTFLRFQAHMTAIKQWNSTVVEEHTAAIETKYPYLADLIAAAFVAYVKVMSSIKLREDKPNIRLKLPTNASFVHKAFVNVAKDFYEDPRLATRPATYHGMRAAIEQTIRNMLPIQDILKAYLGNAVDDEHTVSPVLDELETQSPTMFNEPVRSSPAPCEDLPVPPAPPALPALPVEEPAPCVTAVPEPIVATSITTEVPECKTISIPPAKDDDLFSDADDEETDWK